MTPQAPADDATRIAAATAYIDALVSHRATEVPLAPDAVRIEVGIKTGFSGAHIRRSLERGPQFRVIGGIRELTAAVTAPGVVDTRFLLDTAVLGTNPVIAEITERFYVDDAGQITRIEAKIRPRLGTLFDRLRRG